MAYELNEGNGEDIKEKELSESEERRGKLKLIKNDLLARIAVMWENKENEPILRSDFKLRVRPANMNVETSDIFPFRAVESCFEAEAEKLLQSIGRQFPGRNLIMEFLLYPYEHGGRKMRFDAVFKPLNGVAGVPARNQVPAEEIVVPASVPPPVSEQVAVPESPVQEEQPVPETPVTPAAPKVEIRKARVRVRRSIIDTGIPLPVIDRPLLPSKKERKSTLEQLKEMIREAAALKAAEADPDNGVMDKPLDQAFADWHLYSKSQVFKRIKKAFEAGKINTPRDLVARLGTDDPTNKEWRDFVRRLDAPIGPNWLGESGSRDLLHWMRRNGLIKPDFRVE